MDFVKVFHEATPLLLNGLKLTIGIALLAIALGMVIGFLSCIMGMAKNPILRAISAVYVWLIRGTPMLVQAFFVFYAIPQLVKVMTGTAFTLTPFAAGAITLSLNAGAYISEIFRGGIQSISQGQFRAGLSLGMTYGQTMRYIVLPQAFAIWKKRAEGYARFARSPNRFSSSGIFRSFAARHSRSISRR